MFSSFFYILYVAINIYTWACIVRIFLSWMPQYLMTPVGRFLVEICDPYLAFFRQFKFTYIAGLDFSPILALGALSFFGNVAFSTYALGYFSIIGVIFVLISSVWSVIQFFLNLLIFASLLRFILEFSYKYRSSRFCTILDTVFYPIRSFIMQTFFKNNIMHEKKALLIVFVFFLIIRIIAELLVNQLFMLFGMSALFFHRLF